MEEVCLGGGGGSPLAALANQLSAPLVANKKLIAVDGPKKTPGVVQQLPVSSSSSASLSSEHSDWSGRTPNSLDGSFSTRNNLIPVICEPSTVLQSHVPTLPPV